MSPVKLWLYRLLTERLPESRAYGFKVWLLRWAGARIGRNVRIYSSSAFLGNGDLEIGDDVHIGPRALIYSAAPAKITLGSHVDIGPQVTILTGGHAISPENDHIAGSGTVASVAIGGGSWLGARVTVLPNVTLPPKTVVAAGAVVTASADNPKTLLAGVPAQVKKQY